MILIFFVFIYFFINEDFYLICFDDFFILELFFRCGLGYNGVIRFYKGVIEGCRNFVNESYLRIFELFFFS